MLKSISWMANFALFLSRMCVCTVYSAVSVLYCDRFRNNNARLPLAVFASYKLLDYFGVNSQLSFWMIWIKMEHFPVAACCYEVWCFTDEIEWMCLPVNIQSSMLSQYLWFDVSLLILTNLIIILCAYLPSTEMIWERGSQCFSYCKSLSYILSLCRQSFSLITFFFPDLFLATNVPPVESRSVQGTNEQSNLLSKLNNVFMRFFTMHAGDG